MVTVTCVQPRSGEGDSATKGVKLKMKRITVKCTEQGISE